MGLIKDSKEADRAGSRRLVIVTALSLRVVSNSLQTEVVERNLPRTPAGQPPTTRADRERVANEMEMHKERRRKTRQGICDKWIKKYRFPLKRSWNWKSCLQHISRCEMFFFVN